MRTTSRQAIPANRLVVPTLAHVSRRASRYYGAADWASEHMTDDGTEPTAPDVDVSIVSPPAPEPAGDAGDVAVAVAEAATDDTQQSEIAVLTARVIEQSEHLGRIEGMLSGLETRYAPASNDYVSQSELDAKLAAFQIEPVDDDAVVVEPPEPEPLPDEEGAHGEDAAPAHSGPSRIKIRW